VIPNPNNKKRKPTMTVIDKVANISYPSRTQKEAAIIMKVDRVTLFNWKRCRDMEKYRRWEVYFNEK